MPAQAPDANRVVGFESSDDAAAYRLNDGTIMLQSVDFFTPVVDDPYDFGQIAAANALSDIYAMGGKPLFALNVVGFPSEVLPLETLSRIMTGGMEKAHEAGIHILGGHTISDREPKYGMVVTGTVSEDKLVRNSTGQQGDKLVLTKPLGTGIMATAIKRGLASDKQITAATELMAMLNKEAAAAAVNVGISAMTDVTGFGLLGHLLEMCTGSGLKAVINYSSLPFLEGVKQLAADDVIPGGSERNLKHVKPQLTIANHLEALAPIITADAQTSGGLLIAVQPDRLNDLLDQLQQGGSLAAAVIGELTTSGSSTLTLE